MSLSDSLNGEGHPAAATRVLLAIAGLLVMRVGMQLLSVATADNLLVIGSVVALFATGVSLLVLAAVEVNMDRWGRQVAYGVLAVLGLATLAAMFARIIPVVGTDAQLFSRAAVIEFVRHGTNPFVVDMGPWIERGIGPPLATPKIDGSLVTQLSYPAGAVLVFIPQMLTVGLTDLGLSVTLLAMAVGCVALTIQMLPANLAVGGVVVWIMLRNLLFSAAGGVMWSMWMLPLLLGLRAWAGQRWLMGAAWLGISAGTKQFVWLIVPFLAVWVLREGGMRRLGVLFGAGLTTFSALNLPFWTLNPTAWVDGVLTPLAETPLIQLGNGVAFLAHHGVSLAYWWHSLAVAIVGVVCLVGYWLYFEQVKWAAWLAPPVILFMHSRSLMSYFGPWAAVAALAGLALIGELRTGVVSQSLDSQEEAVADA
jgi:uncharacterized membrane protein